jgi:hypothetical protein
MDVAGLEVEGFMNVEGLEVAGFQIIEEAAGLEIIEELQVWKFKLTLRTPWTQTRHRLQNIGGCRADPAGTILCHCVLQTQRQMGGKSYSV